MGGIVLPVAGEVPDELWEQVAEGQPVILVRNGRPAPVLVDVDSREEVEALTGVA